MGSTQDNTHLDHGGEGRKASWRKGHVMCNRVKGYSEVYQPALLRNKRLQHSDALNHRCGFSGPQACRPPADGLTRLGLEAGLAVVGPVQDSPSKCLAMGS